MSTWVIGDVQGCAAELDELLALIRLDPAHDRVVFVGDLVNRGPDSADVLRRVKALNARGVADSVLGNHDFFLIMAHAGFATPHAGDTLDQVLAADDADDLVAWLRARPLLIDVDDCAVVHAGVLPAWSLADARMLAREVERRLGGADYRTFLQHLFGNDPRTWHEALRDMPRARVIVNAFARLRFCTAESELEFAEKRDALAAPPGFAPWFAHPGRRSAGGKLLAGHWSSEGLRLWPNVTLLDSGCLWGGSLSARRLDDGAVFQVPSRQPLALIQD
ncbi:MAG: symmetrical bis(5'-nucleosyl)-tetraphosphatase [Burkholderiales bacterium]|nr:symmetrical bis(5'-nucleosyl)-tetraphosphatase [Burkholderiales bacterium]